MKKALLIIPVIFILVVSLASCAAGAANGKPAEGWPNDIPSCLPAFTYGIYQSEQLTRIESGGIITYMMRFTGVSKDDVKAYAEELKKTSLTVTVTEAEGMYAVSAGKDVDGYYISPVSAYLEEAVDTCSVNIMIDPKCLDY